MKYLAYLFGGAAAAGAASYVVIYLYRWQWQRAILCGVLLLVVEVLLLGVAVLGRVARLERRIDQRFAEERRSAEDRRQAEVLARLRQPRREEPTGPFRTRFRWLEEPTGADADPRLNRTHVFVPVLMVTGVLLSGLAWIVQRVAESTVRPRAEKRLAGRLAPLAAPPLDPGDGGPELEDRPLLGRGRNPWAFAGVTVTALTVLGAGVAGLAGLTQTRPEPESGAVATSVLVKAVLRDEDSPARADLAAHQVWEHCRDSTSVPLHRATLGELGDGLYAGVVHPALTEHDRMRLRGCLEDTAVNRAHFEVISIGQADPGNG
ncbi:hypothetical protein IHE55_09335 [Streptomyces pactum]|uniref:Uncharacterized protein n=1 Tax=Streptomyces pactum TaxID=68249 RepID=A0ABS0NIF6_9ACTN|nr:hypothetical protein [Streptomyces pactum]MBH5334987.1 hypothetical protein [Streptomyces pactum]